MPEPRRRFRFFADWSHPWPLWSSTGAGYPDELGLRDDDELADRLKAWESHWEEHHPDLDDWDTDEAREWSDREGTELIELLRTAAPQYEIIDEHLDSESGPVPDPEPVDIPSEYEGGELMWVALEPHERVLFLADRSHPWPLWIVRAAYPNHLGISDELAEQLGDWKSHWEEHHPDIDCDDWDTDEAREWSDQEGTRLIELMRAEIPQYEIIDGRHGPEDPHGNPSR